MSDNKNNIEVSSAILTIRGQRVIVDADLAKLYGTKTKRLNEQVKRNKERFPRDFMFQLTEDEKGELVANCDQLKKLKYSKSLPYVFTEHGAVMAANVLNSKVAVKASILVVRAFIQARELLSEHIELKKRLNSLELKISRRFGEHEEELREIRFIIDQLMISPTDTKKQPIGFRPIKKK